MQNKTLIYGKLNNKRLNSSVQSLSCVTLFTIPWTAPCQASLSITNSRNLPNPCPMEDQVLSQLYLHLLQQGLPHLLTLLVSPNPHAPQEALTHSINFEAAPTSPCPHSQQRVTCHPENTGPRRPFICLSCVSQGVTSLPTAVFAPPLNPPVGSLPNIPAPPAP